MWASQCLIYTIYIFCSILYNFNIPKNIPKNSKKLLVRVDIDVMLVLSSNPFRKILTFFSRCFLHDRRVSISCMFCTLCSSLHARNRSNFKTWSTRWKLKEFMKYSRILFSEVLLYFLQTFFSSFSLQKI